MSMFASDSEWYYENVAEEEFGPISHLEFRAAWRVSGAHLHVFASY
jgi:hypothetical protein